MNPFAIRYSARKNEGVRNTDRMSAVEMVEQDGKGKDMAATELQVPAKHTGTGKGG